MDAKLIEQAEKSSYGFIKFYKAMIVVSIIIFILTIILITVTDVSPILLLIGLLLNANVIRMCIKNIDNINARLYLIALEKSGLQKPTNQWGVVRENI